MIIVHIHDTEVRKRQRTSINPTTLHELKEKIVAKGLFHPPVFWRDAATDKWVLSAGERRYKAIQAIHAEGRILRCDGQIIPKDMIPITRLEEQIDVISRFEVELDENIIREELPWPDRVRAFADLHAMRKAANPAQTLNDTGKEIISRGSPLAEKTLEKEVSQAVIIAQHLHNDKIAKARTPAEAVSLIYQMQEEQIKAILVKRQLAKIPDKPTIDIRHGDLFTILPKLDPNIVDLILVDPPYGLGASAAGFRQRTVHHHNYEDTEENAKNIATTILIEGFRVCKPRANLFMFCDIDLFDHLRLLAANMGWSPFRRPLIWRKSESEGMAPWGAQGPRITTEFIFFATKGRRGLNASPTDVFDVKRVPRTDRLHAAEKPVELLLKLINCASLPGDMVLDPCCGSGSTLVAARDSKRHAIGIEKDQDYYNMSMANVFGGTVQTSTTATTNDLME